MAELHDEDRERKEYISRVKASIERHKKMCAELEQACKNTVSEIWQQAGQIDTLMLEAEKPLTKGALKKENMALKEENERLKQVLADCEKKRVSEQEGTHVNMMRPQPCRKFKMISTADWVTKLMEEVVDIAADNAELDVRDWLDNEDMLADKLGEELTDVITVCTSWLDTFGYDEVARGKLQERVNEKNRSRGYW